MKEKKMIEKRRKKKCLKNGEKQINKKKKSNAFLITWDVSRMFQKHSNQPLSKRGWLTFLFFLFFVAELSRENFAHTNALVTRLGGALELFAIADHVWIAEIRH